MDYLPIDNRMKLTKKTAVFSLLTILCTVLLTACPKTNRFTRKHLLNHLTRHSLKEDGWQADGTSIAGFSRTNYLQSKKKIVQSLENNQIQVVNEGNRITLLLPTDKFFIFDSAKLNDFRYKELDDIIKLVLCFPTPEIYVAGFTDNVGSQAHKKLLSQDRAQALVAYLWMKGIPQAKLHAEGYGDRYAIGNNRLIHASAYNRRVEIQWTI
jgi:outer membrane protein OmpA-like peptidoglycan-associated protein